MFDSAVSQQARREVAGALSRELQLRAFGVTIRYYRLMLTLPLNQQCRFERLIAVYSGGIKPGCHAHALHNALMTGQCYVYADSMQIIIKRKILPEFMVDNWTSESDF